MGLNLSSIYYILIVFLPIAEGISLFFIKFKKRERMCTFTVVLSVINSLLTLAAIIDPPKERLYLLKVVGRFDIALGFDGLGTVFACLISFLWPLATLYAIDYMKHEASETTSKESTFYGFFIMSYGFTLGIAAAHTMLTMYIFYEMLTLGTVPLIIFSLKRQAILATRTYLYYSLGGAAFGFVALMFLCNYGSSSEFILGGTLKDCSAPLGLIRIMYVCGFFGFGVKAAVFPLSAWLPKAGVAPTPVTALLHAVAVVKSGAFAILRITYYSFGIDILKGSFAQYIPLVFVIFTIVYGCSQAVRERHLKRRLAYSTVSNLSYILFGCLIMTPQGMAGALAHMIFHGIMKICAFFCAGALIAYTGKEYVYEMDGMARKMPVVFMAFTVSSLSLMGVPGLCGFVGKWNLMSAAAHTGDVLCYLGIGALLISALLTAIYMLQVVVRAYFPEQGFREESVEKYHDPSWKMTVPLVIFILLMGYLGLFSQRIMQLLTLVSEGLFR